MSLKRPFGVTLLLWMVLILSAWGAARFIAALRARAVLLEFDSRLSPLALSITGAGWAVAGGVVLWGALNRRSWARPALPIYIAGWLSEQWIERIFFQSARANLLFSVILSVILLVVALTCTFYRGTKYFFMRSEEHEQPNQHSTPA